MSRVAVLTMQSRALSDAGVRESNEDAVFASSRIAAVADGVSGAPAGEIASRLAIDRLIELDKRRLSCPLADELARALRAANAAIDLVTLHDPRLTGMATTLTAVALSDDGDYLVASVGDSRTYLLRDGRLRRLTRDDTLVQALIDQGALSHEQARNHPQRSVVVEVLDGGAHQPPRLKTITARAGDRLLLCSDGISDFVSDPELTALLDRTRATFALRALIDAALERGGRDNLSAVIADVVAGRDPTDGWLSVLPASS